MLPAATAHEAEVAEGTQVSSEAQRLSSWQEEALAEVLAAAILTAVPEALVAVLQDLPVVTVQASPRLQEVHRLREARQA